MEAITKILYRTNATMKEKKKQTDFWKFNISQTERTQKRSEIGLHAIQKYNTVR